MDLAQLQALRASLFVLLADVAGRPVAPHRVIKMDEVHKRINAVDRCIAELVPVVAK